MPAEAQDTWNRAVHVISMMRAEGISLSEASRKLGIPPRAVIRLAGSALRKRANGRYVARPTDRLLRILLVPTKKGLREIAVRDSRQASRLGEYWASVQRYLETGDATGLNKFRRQRIIAANGVRVPLLTDLAELDRLGNAGVLSFESLYARVG